MGALHLENLPVHTGCSWPAQHQQEREAGAERRRRHFLLPCYRHQVGKRYFRLELQIKIHTSDSLAPNKILVLVPFLPSAISWKGDGRRVAGGCVCSWLIHCCRVSRFSHFSDLVFLLHKAEKLWRHILQRGMVKTEAEGEELLRLPC